MLKLIAAFVIAAVSQIGFAGPGGIWADGVVTYPHPNGQLVNRKCQLWIPAMGQGDVTLKCGDWSASSTEFSTTHEQGKIAFSVIFRDVPGAPTGTAALYRGAYLRGSNRAIYYGDVSSGIGQGLTINSSTGWNYVGGFMFSKEISGS